MGFYKSFFFLCGNRNSCYHQVGGKGQDPTKCVHRVQLSYWMNMWKHKIWKLQTMFFFFFYIQNSYRTPPIEYTTKVIFVQDILKPEKLTRLTVNDFRIEGQG